MYTGVKEGRCRSGYTSAQVRQEQVFTHMCTGGHVHKTLVCAGTCSGAAQKCVRRGPATGAGAGRELCPGEYLNVGVDLLVAREGLSAPKV